MFRTKSPMIVCGFALLLAACESHPAAIKIKGPRDAVESTKANPTFPVFEKKGDTLQLRASGFDEKDRYVGTVPVKWDSSDRSVATVSQTGLMTVLSSGKASISAKYSKGEVTREASMGVEAVIVEGIRLVEPKLEEGDKVLILPMGEKVQFKAEVLNDHEDVIDGGKVRWGSTSYAATVTPTGEVEARAIGTTQITAEAENGSVARMELSVEDWAKKKRRRRR